MPTRVSVITSMIVHSTVLPDTGTTMETTTGVPATAAFPVLAAAVGGGGGAFIAIMVALIVVIVVVFVVRRRGRGKIRTVDSEQEMHNPVYSGMPQTQVCLPHAHCNISNMCSLRAVVGQQNSSSMEVLLPESQYEVPVSLQRNSAIYQTISDPQQYETPDASPQPENIYHALESPNLVCNL